MGLKGVVIMLLGAHLDVGVVGNLAVVVDAEAPIEELGIAAGEAADIEEVEVALLGVKLYLGPSSFSDESRRLRRRSATSSRSSCASLSRLF